MANRRQVLSGLGALALTCAGGPPAPVAAANGIQRAYDIEILPRQAAAGMPGDGWIFGLPPGIATAQWPIDPNNGYPLQHGFTIRLPEDYRVHGPDIVALSFFATAFDHNDGAPTIGEAVRALFDSADAARPKDPDLLPFWKARRSEHPRLFRVRDILDLEYAVILLDAGEFEGAFAEPPRFKKNRHLASVHEPEWLRLGSGLAFWNFSYTPGLLPPQEYYIYREIGGIPPAGLAVNRAIGLTARTEDPNTGKVPRDVWDVSTDGYVQPYSYEGGEISAETYRLHKWSKGHALNHIGGTMRPVQSVPPFSPYYIEFEEMFGGYNFGGGNAQLDFKDMKFDWAQ